MNKVYLIGNLTRDPELRTITNDVQVCEFSIAVQRQIKKDSGQQDVDYFNTTVFGKVGENCKKYLFKGSKVAISGSIRIDNYETSEGQKRQAVRIIANEVEFLSPKKDNLNTESNINLNPSSFEEISSISGSEIPF